LFGKILLSENYKCKITSIVALKDRGQIVLPKKIRKPLKLIKGSWFGVKAVNGEVVLKPINFEDFLKEWSNRKTVKKDLKGKAQKGDKKIEEEREKVLTNLFEK